MGLFGSKDKNTPPEDKLDPAAARARAQRWKNGTPADGVRILLCDDALFILAMEEDVLTKAGYKVVGKAKNGLEAIKLYKELLPDVTLLDMYMPEFNGREALRAIRKFDPTAVAVIVTQLGQESDVLHCIQEGAIDFLIKPFKTDKMLEVVKGAVNTASYKYVTD